ncbi:hypothetical protein [Asanoa iriomotensis]|uniref:PRC-barrel domain protein n=1 Tax=Asanoa iriomotensis TaxID=234613 RepID=A0ABQ4C5V1_9ACTN|nr:hypothetical protein [Asanoa iriomotensis]GIF58158.1 hypothetical protein Air01nite_42530 [Asanoa iriomotensis]
MSDIRSGRYTSDQQPHRLRPGLTVVDRSGAKIGRVRDLHRPDPLAVADDGRRIGDMGDVESMIPGWTRHSLPGVPGAMAARLVREGYVRIVLTGPPPRRTCYAALTDVADVDDDSVILTVGAADLPLEARR